ncbi:MAG: cytochrome c oxidase assembly protein [Firmicutes bacterium]|nr:cytochrome c oxidase assembly protein [Bacillota bacterium]
MPGVLAHAQAGALRWWYPEVLAVIFGFCTVYFYLVGPVRERLGLADRIERRPMIFFTAAMAVMALAEATPLHGLSEDYLFSVHMLQHVLLTMVMPPLFIAGLPDWLVSYILRWPGMRRVLTALTRPVVALLAFNIVNAAWHLPYFYEAPLLTHWLHPVQHALMVITALMMWWPLVSSSRELPALSYGAQVVYIFLILLVQLPVFAGITFADSVFYEFYAQAPSVWGLSPLADQQLAGVVMKLGGMIVMLSYMGRAFIRWVQEDRRELGPAPHSKGLGGSHAG